MKARKGHRTELGPYFSEGARLAWLALDKRGWSQADLQRRLKGRARPDGTSLPLRPGVVSRWLYGDRRPSTDALVQLEHVLGVPVTAWLRPPLRKFSPPHAEAKRTGTDG